MDNDMRTGRQFMQAVLAMKQTLDTKTLEKDLDLEIAVRHNLRRKLRMIRSMQQLYAHLHGNAPMPKTLPSAAFNPFEGLDNTNIHYSFKAMRSVPPWELRKDLLVVPVAVTLLMLEIAAKLFPGPQVFQMTLLVEEFVNRWTLPKFRPEWEDDELQYEIDRYQRDMEDLEKRFMKGYGDLSVFFGSIEEPRKNPVEKKIDETHKHAKSVAEKVCGKEKPASFFVQERALAIWEQKKNSPELKAKCCRKGHRVGYADVYNHCKRELNELGIMSATAFEKAVTAAKKRNLRLANGTKASKRDK